MNIKNTISWLMLSALALTVFSCHAPGTVTPVSFQEIAVMERSLVAQVNAVRRRYNRPVLSPDERVQNLARRYSLDMWERKFFSHNDPDGRQVNERLLAAGIRFDCVAENLGKVSNGKLMPIELLQAWMASAAHRHNIMDGRFTYTAVGIYYSPSQIYYITQIFFYRSQKH